MAEVDGPLVLDTHVWLWMMTGQQREMSTDAVAEIERAGRSGAIRIAAISVWEVAMLERRRRISLSRPVDEWVAAALRAPGTRLLELSPEIAIDSTRLPDDAPGDPADRLLMASARVSGGRLATRDRGILGYAGHGHVACVDVRR